MSKLQTEEKKKQYETYVKEVTPVHNLWMNMAKAFLVGGLICTLGQFLLNWCQNMGMDEKTAGTWCSVILVFLSALTTGLGLYPRLAKWAGAGTLVPITGFANLWRLRRWNFRRKVRFLVSDVKFLPLPVR